MQAYPALELLHKSCMHIDYTLVLDKAVATSNDIWIRITSTDIPLGESDGTWPAGPDVLHRRAGIALKRI